MGITESKLKKYRSSQDKQIKRLENRIDQIFTRMNDGEFRINKVEESHNKVVSALDETKKRFDDLLMHITVDSESNKEGWKTMKEENIRNQKHRDRIERMLCTFGSERSSLTLASPTTIDEWIGKVQIGTLISIVDEQKILKIKRCISASHIKMVGRHLGLREHDICEIEVDLRHQLAAEAAYQMLIKWKNKMGQKATVGCLTECLFEAAKEDPRSINVESLTEAILFYDTTCVNLRRTHSLKRFSTGSMNWIK